MLDRIRARVSDFLTERAIGPELEQLNRMAGELRLQRESLSRLQLEMENEGYQRLTQFESHEIRRDILGEIVDLARVMFIKNPNIKRSICCQADYVFGQGFSITAKEDDANTSLESFWEDPENRKTVSSHPAQISLEWELQTTGNLFLTFHNGGSRVVVRRIDFSEIQDIYCDPEDAWSPWFYKRVFRVGNDEQVRWYPDIHAPESATIPADYPDADKPKSTTRVFHVAVNKVGKSRFGIPDVFPSLAWALAYKRFLENWTTIMAAYARMAMKVSGMSKKQKAAAKSKLQSTIQTISDVAEGNPSNVAGGFFLGTEGVDISAIKTAGATTPAEEGKPLLCMVASGVGLPVTFFGDASIGNYATSKTLDRPTELKFISRQELWKETFREVAIHYLQTQGIKLSSSKDLVATFPDILERNVTDRVRATVNALTLFGKTLNDLIPDKADACRMLLEAMGVPDIDRLVAKYSGMWASKVVPPPPDPMEMAKLKSQPGGSGAEDPSQGGDVGSNG